MTATTTRPARPPRLLHPGEVAAMFGVHPKTLTRWANEGLIDTVRTLRGHRRYKEAVVLALMETGWQPKPTNRPDRVTPPARLAR